MKKIILFGILGAILIGGGVAVLKAGVLQRGALVPVALQTTTPTIGAVSATPNLITVNTPTAVVVTAVITDPNVIPTDVNLLRLNATGTPPTVLGVLRDDGTNGDVAANDKTFTLRVNFNETDIGPLRLQVSAALIGALRRVISGVDLAVQGLIFSDIVKDSPLVVIGIISSTRAYYDENLFIMTDIQFHSRATIKGTLRSSIITITVRGGIIGTDDQQPFGRNPFLVGQEVLMLLDGPRDNDKYFPSHGALDIFLIQTNATNNKVAVIDGHYGFQESAFPLDTSYKTMLDRSSQGLLPLETLILYITE